MTSRKFIYLPMPRLRSDRKRRASRRRNVSIYRCIRSRKKLLTARDIFGLSVRKCIIRRRTLVALPTPNGASMRKIYLMRRQPSCDISPTHLRRAASKMYFCCRISRKTHPPAKQRLTRQPFEIRCKTKMR